MKQPSLRIIIAALASLLFMGSEVLAQGKVQRFEIGGQFSRLSLYGPSSQASLDPYFNVCKPFPLLCARVELGFGARLTYNLTNHIAIEAEGNFFPGRPVGPPLGDFLPTQNTVSGVPGGHIYQGQFGVKAGKRFKKVGLFMKIRPGFVGFTQVTQLTRITTITAFNQFLQEYHYDNPEFRTGKETYSSVDVGGVIEFYPSRRIVTRLDIGDTIIRYGIYRDAVGLVCVGFSSCPRYDVFVRPAETRHNLQFSAGIGIRF